MVIDHDMIFGNSKEEEDEDVLKKIDNATIVKTSFGDIDKTIVLAATEYYARDRVRKIKYRRSDKGKDAKRRELDDRLLERKLFNLVRRGYCICSLSLNDCKDVKHLNIVNQYKKVIERYSF